MADNQKIFGNPITGRENLPMTDHEKQECQAQKSAMASFIWMQYFNRTLYEQGLITEEERNRMKIKIDARYNRMQSLPAAPDLHSGHCRQAVID